MAGIDKGWLADEVFLRINGEDIAHRCEEYSVNISVFRQPAAFTARVSALSIEDVFRYDIEMPFELALRHTPFPGEPSKEVVLQTGRIDSIRMDENSGTTIQISGRDNMRELLKSYFEADTEYSQKSYYDLVLEQLKAVGFTEDDLKSGDTAREKMAVEGTQTPAPRAASKSPEGKTQVVEQAESGSVQIVYNTITGDAGQQRYAWLQQQLKRAGLFLWCGPQGWFLLSAPNASQEPAFEINRTKSGTGNAKLVGLGNNATNLHTHVRVIGRGGGGKDGQRRVESKYTDPAMLERVQKYGAKETTRIDIDEQIHTAKEAAYKARRIASEERRDAFSIEYELAGHTMPALHAPGNRTVALPNFCARVNDEWAGFQRVLMWNGDVTFSRSESSGTRTRVKLYRTDDLVFATEG